MTVWLSVMIKLKSVSDIKTAIKDLKGKCGRGMLLWYITKHSQMRMVRLEFILPPITLGKKIIQLGALKILINMLPSGMHCNFFEVTFGDDINITLDILQIFKFILLGGTKGRILTSSFTKLQSLPKMKCGKKDSFLN